MSRHARIRKIHAPIRKMHAWGAVGYILTCMFLVSVFPRQSGALLYQRRGHLAAMPNTNHLPTTRYHMALRGGQGSNCSVQGGDIWDISGMQRQTHLYYLNAQYTVCKVCLPTGFCFFLHFVKKIVVSRRISLVLCSTLLIEFACKRWPPCFRLFLCFVLLTPVCSLAPCSVPPTLQNWGNLLVFFRHNLSRNCRAMERLRG
jgi:hypothetical protein